MDVLADGLEQVDRAARARAHSHLAHIHVGKVQQRASLAHRDHRHRTVAAARDNAAAFEWIESQVHGFAACADVFTSA